MKSAKIKLPKQWKHWCADSKLKPHSRTKSGYGWFYLTGHGYHWRLNCHNKFQIGDSYENFDRWALCDIYETDCPSTRAEFRAAVAKLLSEKTENLDAGHEHEECYQEIAY